MINLMGGRKMTIYNIEDYRDDTVTAKEQEELICNAISLIANQLADAKDSNDYQAIASNRIAMNEFIREWQSVRGVI